MLVVAFLNGGNESKCLAVFIPNLRERYDISRQCSAGKGSTWTKVGLGANARFASQPGRNVRCIRPDMLAHPGNLIDKGDAQREKGVKCVLHHFRRLGPHEEKLRREWAQ